MNKNFNTITQLVYFVALVFLLLSCSKEDFGTFEFMDQNPQGIIKMDISNAIISEQYGDKNWEFLSDSELNDYFVRLKGINIRKIDDKTLLIDNYNFSKKADLVKLDQGYYFGVIYELPLDKNEYVSPIMITLFGTITGNKIVASYSTNVSYYNIGWTQEYTFHASYTFETSLSWLSEKQWEPASPKITDIDDLGFNNGIRIFFAPNNDDFVSIKEYRIYRIDDITDKIDYTHIGTIQNTGKSHYYFNDVTSWALHASYLSTPGYLVTSIGSNGIESFLTQEAFKAIVIKR
jgi:hypothetical protein